MTACGSMVKGAALEWLWAWMNESEEKHDVTVVGRLWCYLSFRVVRFKHALAQIPQLLGQRVEVRCYRIQVHSVRTLPCPAHLSSSRVPSHCRSAFLAYFTQSRANQIRTWVRCFNFAPNLSLQPQSSVQVFSCFGFWFARTPPTVASESCMASERELKWREMRWTPSSCRVRPPSFPTTHLMRQSSLKHPKAISLLSITFPPRLSSLRIAFA